MKQPVLAVGALGLALCTLAFDAALAARGSTREKRRVSVSQQVTASPSSVISPLNTAGGMTVCASGFAEGNFVSIVVPWWGSPTSHSNLTFSKYIDSSGGFCITSPPSWTTMTLEPGTYTIGVYWYSDGGSGDRRAGPTTTFDVSAQ
jgi:hypothetical protein